MTRYKVEIHTQIFRFREPLCLERAIRNSPKEEYKEDA